MFEYYMPTRILFGAGSLEKLATANLPGTKALIITSGTSTTKYGYVDKVISLLKQNNIDSIVYKDIKPNPTKNNVHECRDIAVKENVDLIVGLGGGSSIDASKSVAMLVTNGGDYWDYMSGSTGLSKVPSKDPLPIIAITTTAGTGTEADPWTVITKEETFEKVGYGYDKTFPYLSIVDENLMLTVPKHLTAYQGFDALFHSTEGYIANIANPVSDMFALKSIELIGANLALCVKNGNDKGARANVALANSLSGFVECSSSCTSEHSIEHALSAHHTELPHGAGLIMISLEYYKMFLDVVPERFIAMAKALGNPNANKAEDFITALEKLQKDCLVADLKMSDYGIDHNNFKVYAQNAFDNMGGLFELDRKKLSIDDVVNILKKSYR